MSKEYTIIDGELYHYGRKGMKWGQHIFGKVKAAAGRRREQKKLESIMKKPVRKLSDAELSIRKKRIEQEREVLQTQKNVSELNGSNASRLKKIGSTAIGKVLVPSMIDAGKSAVTAFLGKKFKDVLGLDKEDTSNILDILARKGLRNMTDAEISKLGKRAEHVGEAKKQLGIKVDDDNNSGNDNQSKSENDSKPKTESSSNNSKPKTEGSTGSSKSKNKKSNNSSRTADSSSTSSTMSGSTKVYEIDPSYIDVGEQWIDYWT